VRAQVLPLLPSLLGLLLVVGCTTTSAGTPAPDSGVSPSGSEQPASSGEDRPEDDDLPSDGAPDIKDPLDISKFLADPCRVLTAEQTEQLGVPQTGEPSEETLGKVCSWRNPETRGATDIRMDEKYRRGLSAVYAADKRGEYVYFKPLEPIEGYPAVASDITDERDRGTCIISVGVANDLMFAVGLDLSTENVGKKDPCETAVVVVGMMLRTMKEGA
jgi:hypothetical protein